MRSMLFAFFLLTSIATARNDLAASFGDNPASGKYYDINGIRMYAESYGCGRPLLLIHGNGGSIAAFSRNIPYFAANYHVIVADSRAQGKSRDDSPALTFELMADDYAALLDAMHIDSADIIGWSDGGIIGLLLAMRHPAKVRRLAISGANLRPDASALAPGVWEADRERYERDKDKVWQTEKERNDWKLFMLNWRQPNIPVEALRAIKSPALIICGDRDIIALEHTVEIYRGIPGASLWVVPDCGHATLIDYADEFNRTVGRFFSARHEQKN